jgi:hypothetical protein
MPPATYQMLSSPWCSFYWRSPDAPLITSSPRVRIDRLEEPAHRAVESLIGWSRLLVVALWRHNAQCRPRLAARHGRRCCPIGQRVLGRFPSLDEVIDRGYASVVRV